jgi:hypothetical protein
VVVSGHPSIADIRSLTPLVRRYSSVALIDAAPDPANQATAPGVRRLPAATSEEFADQWNLGWFA